MRRHAPAPLWPCPPDVLPEAAASPGRVWPGALRLPILLQVLVRGMLAVLLMGAVLGPALAAASPPERTVTVVNHADQPINEVYASASASDDWGPDWLGDDTIEPRQQRRIGIGPAAPGTCRYDLQIVYGDASREERRAVDLCRNRSVVFDGKTASPAQGAEGGAHAVLIANDSALPIQQILISPAEAGEWGEDRLGSESLSVGEAATIAYFGGCLADLRVVFENRAAEERRGLDLCRLGGVSVQPGWTTQAQLPPIRPALQAGTLGRLGVAVINRSGRPVRELYLFPEPSAASGPNRLVGGALEDGGRVVVELERAPGSCRFGARVVYGGKTPNQDFSGLDLCQDPTLLIAPRT